MKRNHHLLIVTLLLAVPSVALANAGTPLMWASSFHLFFGNFVIGIFEGFLLAKVYGLAKGKTIGRLILANYFSAWVGIFILGTVTHLLPIRLPNLWLWFGLLVLMTYLLTLMLEFPFVAWAFRGDSAWRRKSIRGSLLVQTASYVILFGWYWLASGTSLLTQASIVDISSISLPEKVLVYFISADDGDVYAGTLQQRKWEKVFDLNSVSDNDRLLVRPSSLATNRWNLLARLETNSYDKPNMVTIQEKFALIAAPIPRDMAVDSSNYDGNWFNFGPAPKLGNAQSSSWEFRTGFWARSGLSGSQSNSGNHVYIALETPFVDWTARNATHLPDDKVLFQFGADQICIYDPKKQQIALLVRGRGPIAVMQDDQ